MGCVRDHLGTGDLDSHGGSGQEASGTDMEGLGGNGSQGALQQHTRPGSCVYNRGGGGGGWEGMD